MADDDIPGVCDACEVECRADVACNCGMEFCSSHWARHQMKHPTHRKAASGKVAKLWDWVKGNVNNLKSSTARAARFEKDEGSKWFGFVVESFGAERTTSILETARFSMLMEGSMLSSDEGPTSRYPSIVSFVGECGAGKSTLIRALVSYATPSNGGMQDLDVPIPGAQSGPDALVATTGEVNLYPDPSSFGTETPRLYADCEGLFGGEPCAAKHQWRWREHGRRYPLAEKKDGKMVDRRTAVQTIYPRFLYMFSDVICLVTRNPKRWADEAVQLLQWASVGAHHTVNQYALPAAIIILNGPHSEDPVWVSDDLGYLTRQFFKNVNGEMETNSVLQEMATKHGVNTLEDLFSRNFSSVYVHFVPHDQSKLLGSPDIILQQHERLFYRLKADTARVQVERERSWTKFDSKQISVLFHYVFKHLANHSDEPFDFSSCRRQVSLPQTVQGHLSEFLQLSLGNSLGENFAYASKMVASYLCQNASREEGRDLVLRPEVILSSDSKSLCRGAIEEFLDTGLPCSFVDPIKTKRCVNTKRGHVKGHQDRHGALLWNGPFVTPIGSYTSTDFGEDVQLEVTTILHDLQVISNGGERVKFLTRRHLLSLASAPVSDFWGTISNAKPRGPSGSSTINALTKAIDRLLGISESNHSNTCFGCVFKNPEYEFPCGHYLCSRCIQDFDQSNHFGQYPGTVTFHFCVLCGANRDNEGWPFRVSISPKISGLRLLSLDGGGVRGVVEIITLKRIEDGIGLSLPIGEFFDFVAGTSAGGMIALGVGFHGWDAETCMAKYDAMIRGGLSKKFGTTAPGPIGSIVRWLRGSLYETRPLEKALQQAYPQEKMYGLRRVGGSKLHNLPRVAVTTTVNGGEARLFANYSCGDNKSFLNSSALTWEVARSTSAAPIYFEAYHVPTAGVDCRDGGLRDNNPIQIAVDESRRIWGPHTTFDAILSIGSGSALNPPRRPKTHGKLPERFATLVETFFRTMDGQEAWERYKKGVYGTLDFRSYRFNVKFKGANQPPLDAVSEIDNMVAETTNYFFHMNNNPSDPLAIMPPVQDAIQEVALRLRASLFFFEPDNIVYNKDRTIAMVRGHICSRLTRNSEALRKLIALTEGFMIQETFFNVPIPAEHMLLKVPVRVQQVINATSTQFRIDVKFKEGGYIVPISGCPISLETIKDHIKGIL